MLGFVSARRAKYSSGAVGLACLAVFGVGSAAKAAPTPVTFAQFSQTTNSANANQFEYVDNGPNLDAELFSTSGQSASIPVVFDFLSTPGLPSDLQGTQAALLTLTTSSTSSAQSVPFFGQTLGAQQINSSGIFIDTLTITRDTAAAEGNGGKTILLQVQFTGTLAGLLGTRVPILQGSSSTGDTITYSSDFLNFSNAASNDYNIAFSSWISAIDSGGLELSATAGDHYFATATAAGAGTFDTTFAPSIGFPEPSSLALLSVGAASLMARRRRKA